MLGIQNKTEGVRITSNLAVIVVFFIASIIVLGCKNSNKPKSEDGSELPADRLIVELNAEIRKDDIFELFFRRQDEVFSDQKKVTAEIKGSDKAQTIRFILNQGEFPTHFRLDLGQNEMQRSLQIVELALRYNEGMQTFTKEEFIRYFKPNIYVSMNNETLKIQLESKNNKYDPYLESNNLSKFVNKLILY